MNDPNTVSLTNPNLFRNPEAVKELFRQRDQIVTSITQEAINASDEIANTVGLYPDISMPNFIERLLQRTEFAETQSKSFEQGNPCESGIDFEVTPVQKFVSNFIHPNTPYNGMLLYHGVGVGKTCAAILSAEAHLESHPYKKVIIIAPPNIQPGFYRTIFDPSRLVIGNGDEPNTITGCVGDLYLHLTNNLYTRDAVKVQRNITRLINKRYSFYGYIEFANYIRDKIINKISKTGDPKKDTEREHSAIRREFNYRLFIIDEAHNLRDTVSETTDDIDTSKPDIETAKNGKILTPQLERVLRNSEGMKLILMTATPMFNSVREIFFLFKLLLLNDKRDPLREDQVLDKNGDIIPTGESTPGGREILGKYANQYISFMRGENPNSFPLRLKPFGLPTLTLENYPKYELAGGAKIKPVSREEIQGIVNLPFVTSPLKGTSETVLKSLLVSRTDAGIGYTVLDGLLQAGNVVFPGFSNPEQSVGNAGFDSTFQKVGVRVKTISGDASWLKEDRLAEFSPKGATILNLIRNSEGVAFVYSRFVLTGAYFLALALEANGYTQYGTDTTFLSEGIQDNLGRQCAMCPNREKGHPGDHSFIPAKYVILTGDSSISPNNEISINAERLDANYNGSVVKVVLGSQIAAEGLDLKFVRSVHILDAWFHLNKTEQIIGRGIRFCSHSLIPEKEKRNTTIFIHVVSAGQKETADLYAYRLAYKKALRVGKVSRVLKEFAIDCNLRKDATVISIDTTVPVVDSQRSVGRPDEPLRDMPYSPICDWLPECSYTCTPIFNIENIVETDDSTYSQFTARFRESILKREIMSIFAVQPSYKVNEFEELLIQRTGAPLPAILMILGEIVGNKSFSLKNGNLKGYLEKRNGFYVFQPHAYKYTNIPSAIRIADFPIKRDSFTPELMDIQEEIKPEEEAIEAEQQIGAPISRVKTIRAPWKTFVKWVDDVANKKINAIDGAFESEMERYSEGVAKKKKILFDKCSMILYFFTFNIKEKEAAKQICLEFLWDNFLSLNEQIATLDERSELMLKVGKENYLESGSIKAYRFLNYNTGLLDFICDDKKPCSRAISDAFLTDPDDLLRKSKADTATAGKPYGFMSAKRGKLVFKTQDPHGVGKEPDRGQECGNVTSTKDKIEKLVALGKAYGEECPFELQAGKLASVKELTNATKICVFLELVLRYMNQLKINSKVWFFRPIASYYSNHKFLQSSKVKSQIKVVAKKSAAPSTPAPAKKSVKLVLPSTPAPAKKSVKLVLPSTPAPAPATPAKKSVKLVLPSTPLESATLEPATLESAALESAALESAALEPATLESAALEPMITSKKPVKLVLPPSTKPEEYKGAWTHKGKQYIRDGLSVKNMNGNFEGIYDPETNTIDTEAFLEL